MTKFLNLKIYLKRTVVFVLVGAAVNIAYAKENDRESQAEFKYKNKSYQVDLEFAKVTGSLEDQLSVTDNNGKTIMEFKPKDASFYTAAEVINLPGYDRPLLITKWNHGANHVVLRIFDPILGDKALLKEVMSRSEVKYEAQEEKIIIDSTEDDYGNVYTEKKPKKAKSSSLNLKDVREVWRPNKK